MKTLTLVAKNLSRRKGRSIISSIGLILAIAVIVSTFTVSSAMQTQIGDEIDKYGPNIIITPNTQSLNVPYGSIVIGNITIREDALDKIQQIPNKENINVLSPKLYKQIQHEGSPILVVGILPQNEMRLKRWWQLTGVLPENLANQILVGSTLKEALNLSVNSAFQINNETFIVTGVLDETGSIDDYSIFMPLQVAQSLFGLEGQVSEIDVGALCNTCPVEEIAQQIMDAVPDVKAIPVKQAVETRMQAVQQTANFSFLLASIILVVGVAGVTNTMLASVHERIKEIGVLMSLGADNSHLYKMFLSESVILGLAGGLIGSFIGVVSSVILGPLLIGATITLSQLPLFVIPLAVGLSVSASVAASLYPTWRASKVDPVKALKAV